MSAFSTFRKIQGAGGGLVLDFENNPIPANVAFLEISHTNWTSYDRDKFAIETFFRPESLTSGGSFENLMSKFIPSGSNEEFILRIRSDDKIEFQVRTIEPGVGTLRTTATISAGDKHHLLVHYDGANVTAGDRMRMWLDGTEVTAFDIDNNPTGNTTVKTEPTYNVQICC